MLDFAYGSNMDEPDIAAAEHGAGAVPEGTRPHRRYYYRAVRGAALAWTLPPTHIACIDRVARRGLRSRGLT
jgi:hypothetical protein